MSVDSLKCVRCPSHRGIHLIERESIVKVKKTKNGRTITTVLLRELSLEKWTKTPSYGGEGGGTTPNVYNGSV